MNQPGILDARRLAALAFALVMALALTASLVGSQAEAAKKKKAKPAKVAVTQIVTKNQQQLLNQKKLVVKVRSTGKATAKLSVVSGGKKNLFRAQTVKFRKKGTKKVNLALTAAGRTQLGTCGAKAVKVTADYRRGKKKAKAVKSKTLARNAALCPVAPNVNLNKASDQTSPTNQPAIRFTLESDKALDASTVTTSDFSVTNATVSSVSGSGSSFEVAVNGTATGDVTVSPSASFSVASTEGAVQTSAGGSDRTVAFDITPPNVNLGRADGQGAVTNEPEGLEFALTSSKALNASTVTAADFQVTNGTIEGVSGSGNTFVVEVDAASEGDVTIAPSGSFSVADGLGNTQTSVGGSDRTIEYDVDWRHVPVGANPDRCDFLDQSVCLQPWPNDYYTVDDPSTDSGKRLNLNPASTPVNTGNASPTNLDVTDINRGDGFSPGNLITLKVPGLDTPAAVENTGFVPLEDISDYMRADQPVLLIDAETGERQPIWAEIDSNPTTVDPSGSGPGGIGMNPTNTDPVNVIVRPAKNLEWGHRYIVAFRNLKDGNDQAIEAPLGFQVYRDNLRTTQGVVEDRRPHMESIIDTLVDDASVDRSSLYMAWDFTVASQDSVTGRALTIRDDAFERLGDIDLADRKIDGDSPDVDVRAWCDASNTSAATCGNNYPGRGAADFNPSNPITSPVPGGDEQRTVTGYIRDVPCYLNSAGCTPGGTFTFNANNELTWDVNNKVDVPFLCTIPKSIVSGNTVHPGGSGVYGHGLLGLLNQVRSGGSTREIGNVNNSVWCGANWDGFSSLDAGTIVQSLMNMSNFPKAVDRMQQGFVNFMMIQRAMIHEDGFAAEPGFQMTHNGNTPVSNPGTPAIDVSAGEDTRGYYHGISQGGIMGGALTALSPDVDRGVLGVPGINYSTLLRRSVDSDEYFKAPGIGLYANYPSEIERPLMLSLVQLLWDRGEGNGYANNLSDDPLPNTNPHEVLLGLALGDHQVTNYAAEVEARTIGAKRYSPTLVPQRTWDLDYEALPPVNTFPTSPGESIMVYYDSGPPSFSGTRGAGAGMPPLENVPPRTEWGYGRDPHGDPRASADGIAHAASFLLDGTIDACAAASDYCFANGWDGTTGLP